MVYWLPIQKHEKNAWSRNPPLSVLDQIQNSWSLKFRGFVVKAINKAGKQNKKEYPCKFNTRGRVEIYDEG